MSNPDLSEASTNHVESVVVTARAPGDENLANDNEESFLGVDEFEGPELDPFEDQGL